MKIWNKIPIKDNKDKLITIPNCFKFISPHPYYDQGAPYKAEEGIWKLREEVVNRLIKVNEYLKLKNKSFYLLIYDSWRPIEVQEYMFNRAFNFECKRLDIDASVNDIDQYPLVKKTIEKFWAYPSFDERYPPPHSTGGALDITLADMYGNTINMGSDIDQMDEKSRPDFYKNFENKEAIIWNDRRNLLNEIMNKFDFVQHPNEWWHFSYGDQLWAWKTKKANAIYGKL
mgnify:CR=1 FL=1